MSLLAAVKRFEDAKGEYNAAAVALQSALDSELQLVRQASRPPPLRLVGGEIDTIVGLVAHAHGVSISDILSRKRDTLTADARQQAMVIVRRMLHLPMERIGAAFERDHGTVMHADNAIAARCATEPEYRREFDELMALCSAGVAKVRAAA